MRLQRGGAYTSDVQTLRDQVRANGTRQTLVQVPMTHPNAPGVNVRLVVNLAFQANSQMPPANASLYTLGVQNGHGIWYFNVPGVVPAAGPFFPGNPDGSYLSLGVPGAFPQITDADLVMALNTLHAYAGAGLAVNGANTALVRLIIALSEAMRFDDVLAGVNGVLGNAHAVFNPPAGIRNWGGHRLG